MKPKTMILMVVAVTCGLGASYMTSRLLAERGDAPETPKVKILVAKKTLNQGDTLKNPQDLFEEKVYTEGEEPRAAIASFDQLKGRIIARSLRAGDHITAEDTFDPAKGYHMMSWALPDGMYAVGIRVNLADIAGGFASLPHSRVNVYSTVKRGSDKDSYSMLLLENVLVLAADQNMNLPDGKALPATVVTLAVTGEDALRLNLAKEQGPLSLALRKFNDKSKSEVDKITGDQLVNRSFGKPSEIEEPEKPQPQPVVKVEPKIEPKIEPKAVEPRVEIIDTKPVTTTVRYAILKGNQITYQEFVLDEAGNVISQQGSARSEPPAPQPAPPPAQKRKDGQ